MQRPPGATRERSGAGGRRDRPERSPQPPPGRRLPGKPRARLGPAAAAAPAAPPFPGAAAAAGAGPGLCGGARRGKPQPRAGSGSGSAPPAAAPRGRRGRCRCCPPARGGVRRPRHPPTFAVPGSAPPLPPARRRAPDPSPAGATAPDSPGSRSLGPSPWLAPPSPSSQSARLFSMAPAARGRTLLPGSCERRAPQPAASPRRPPPSPVGGGCSAEAPGALGSLLPAEPSPAAHFITYAGGIAPAAVGRGAAAGRGEAGEGAERSARRLPAEPGGGRN